MSEAASKPAVRSAAKAAVSTLSSADRAAASAAICSRILALDQYQKAASVMLYAGRDDEPDLATLAQHALATGKTVLAPRVDWQSDLFTGGIVQHWPGDLEPHPKGFGSARFDAPSLDPASIHLVLVPGLAFDRSGGRVGRGKGHYDRFLTQVARARRLGVCFGCQVLERVPADEHDQPMATIVTEEAVG